MLDMKQIKLNQKKMKEDFEAIRKEYREKSQTIFKQGFSAFFEQVPIIKAVSWTQYTPYFNDGEPCVFQVGDMWFLTEKGLEDFRESGGGYAEGYAAGDKSYYEEEYRQGVTTVDFDKIADFKHFLSGIDEDIYEHIFGDHVYVIATKDGFEVEEYHHD